MKTPVQRAKPYSLTSVERLQAMQEACTSIDQRGVQGDIVECGVWQGGNIILARLCSPNRRCWLFDTFTGMAKPTPVDISRSGGSALAKWQAKSTSDDGWCRASVEQVTKNLVTEGVYDRELCRFMVGDVCAILRQPEILPEQIALLRLDTDWYESTKIELEVLWPKLVTGGIIIIDDYGHWDGCRKAVQEYFKKHHPDYLRQLVPIDYTAVMLRK